ncbi:AaceriAER308Cp [[Ashbya] aceris (nom. inval.)]|nr:AaceriAER308Cp [[Ashbya] aceris (nom. inval.)]
MAERAIQYMMVMALRMGWAAGAGNDAGTTPGEPDGRPPIDGEPDENVNPITEEIFSSWALCILLFLLIAALWTNYYLTQRRIRAVHETVLSIFYGMLTGFLIRVSPGHYIQDAVTFNSSYFFNFLLPPIILNSGYELNQANFFSNIVSILTFAIPGTFISAVVLGVILYLWTALGLESIDISFLDALSVGATLSATDPVTILSIFNAYKVDPKLYTIIFGESLLNDAISIVIFETCQKFHGKPLRFMSFFEGIGLFLMTFTISLLIGVMVGILVALILKHSHVRRYPQIESCLVLLIAYESYFFSNGCHMSGIVSLLFCGITLKHYAYYNMSRRTQLTIKYIFQLLARLSENFIFIYLGLALFTQVELVYKPMLIIVTAISICIARWCAVFPLSDFVNWLYRVRTMGTLRSRTAVSIPDEIPYQYQMMTFWAGLRGAVGVALAMGLQGEFKFPLLATVLVVVVLTVIIFGGTTAGMLEILNIRTGCVEEQEDTDDEFDIEAPRPVQLMSSLDEPPFSVDSPSGSPDQENFPPMIDRPSSRSASGSDQPMGRLSLDRRNIRETLGNILQADGQWFNKFDERVLKPVFLDNPSASPSNNNQSGSTTFIGNRRS